MVGLPGIKLGWILLSGRQARVRRSLEVMELISDTFLPVNDLAQHMVRGILESREAFAFGLRPWLLRCRQIAGDRLSQCPGVRFTLPRGGFYLTLKVGGAEVDEEALCIELLRKSGVLVHPGYFYDMAPAHLVLTFALQHELAGPLPAGTLRGDRGVEEAAKFLMRYSPQPPRAGLSRRWRRAPSRVGYWKE